MLEIKLSSWCTFKDFLTSFSPKCGILVLLNAGHIWCISTILVSSWQGACCSLRQEGFSEVSFEPESYEMSTEGLVSDALVSSEAVTQTPVVY